VTQRDAAPASVAGEVSVAARAAPVAKAAAHDTTSARRCRNCGADAPWNYCPSCGQETAIALPSAFTFLREAAGRYVRFDGRMWRSLSALLFRPGFLTHEYLAGRRRRYVRPARLFVALSIVLFAVLRFSAGTPVIGNPAGEDPLRDGSVEHAGGGTSKLGLRVDPDFNLSFDAGASPWLTPLRARVDAFNRLPRQAKADQVVAGMFRYAPYAAIGLLPLFALLLQLVYLGGWRRHPRRPRRYAAHLVFAAHNHAFVFLVATVIALVDFRPLGWTLLAWALVYALASMRSVYGGSWLGVVLRAAVIASVYAVFFMLATAAVIVAAVALR